MKSLGKFKKTILLLFPFLLAFCSVLYADPMGGESSSAKKIIINNRPLIKINGKVISLVDVVKKMDLFAKEYYPQIINSLPDRYQFYMQNWRHTLEDMIQSELIYADAEGKDVKISDGDIREDMLERFGPRLMTRLDELNLSYEEANEMTRKELIVRKMKSFKIHSKAFQMITPKVIKDKYDQFIAENPPLEQWEYKVISFRGSKEEALKAIAEEVFHLLTINHEEIENAVNIIKEKQKELSSSIVFSISDIFRTDEKTISKDHKTVLQTLEESNYSSPIQQTSRFDKNPVYRIFYLLSHKQKVPPLFEAKAEEIRNHLIQEAVDAETNLYIEKLYKRYGVDRKQLDLILPKGYQPFVIGN